MTVKAKTPAKKAAAKPSGRVVILPPKMRSATITIRGTSPYVQHAFPEKARLQMMATQEAGSQAKKGRTREAKDFDAAYKAAMHISKKGWIGIPACAVRCALISACRTVGFKMTLAKLSVFAEADGYDANGIGLIRIVGTPRKFVVPARNANGAIDLRARPIWDEWSAKVRLTWDEDQFSASDIVNLLARVGLQVGLGEGRHDSRMSAGCGWGCFKVVA